MSLEDYVSVVVNTNQTTVPDFKFISATKHDFSDNFSVAFVNFSGNGGRMFYRMIYIYQDLYIYNFTYSFNPAIKDITDLIDYSFSSFQLESEIKPNTIDEILKNK